MESFNGRLRDECLNEHLFASLKDARGIIEAWRIDYNTQRTHTRLNGLTPIRFAPWLWYKRFGRHYQNDSRDAFADKGRPDD